MTPRPHRIAVTADVLGGVWRASFDLARALKARGQEVTLVVLGPPPAQSHRAACAAVGLDLHAIACDLEWTARDRAGIAQARRTLAAATRGVDLVHLSSPALASPDLPPTLGCLHSCLETWRLATGRMPSGHAWRIAALRDGLRACDALAAPTLAFAATAIAAHLISVPVHVIPNAVGAGWMRSTHAPLFDVVAAGRLWDHAKEARTLASAAAIGALRIDAFGPTTAPHGEAIELPGLRLHGPVSRARLYAAFARARVFASAARYEPFGLSALEAARAGCALVLSDIATHREIWADAATYAPVGDATAFAGACRALIADPQLCAARARAARTRARGYTLAAMADSARLAHDAACARRAERRS